jgi:hypothetical protein
MTGASHRERFGEKTTCLLQYDRIERQNVIVLASLPMG